MRDINPEKLYRLKNLRHIFIAHNQMTNLPTELCLSTIRSLSLADNLLDHGCLPEGADLINLSQLSLLDLSHNKFGEIPPQICCLSTLQELRMNNNRYSTPQHNNTLTYQNTTRLTYVREEFPLYNLKELVVLDLSNNKLRKFGPRAARYALLSFLPPHPHHPQPQQRSPNLAEYIIIEFQESVQSEETRGALAGQQQPLESAQRRMEITRIEIAQVGRQSKSSLEDTRERHQGWYSLGHSAHERYLR